MVLAVPPEPMVLYRSASNSFCPKREGITPKHRVKRPKIDLIKT
jgi:hypothetical protein